MRKGFTLIELVIVISIIAVLGTFGTLTFQHSLVQARDAKRITDIKQIQAALEIYKETNGSYPDTTGLGYSGSGWVNSYSSGGSTSMNIDPQNGLPFDFLVPKAYAAISTPVPTPTPEPGFWIQGLTSSYIKSMPRDPKNVLASQPGAPDQSGNYLYSYFSGGGMCGLNGGDYYILATKLEDTNSSSANQQTLVTSGCYWPSSKKPGIFAVTNP
jgi:prepilin-type N-terminal cleavage/methylation domain-containing protein